MAEFIYTTDLRRHGPWLIDASALDTIDEVIEKEFKRLEEAAIVQRLEEARDYLTRYDYLFQKSSDQIETRIAKYVEEHPLRMVRRITIYLKNGNKFTASSFAEARRDSTMQDQRVTGIRINLEGGRIVCELEIVTDSYSDDLHLRVSPEASAVGREVFASFRDWVRSNQPPYWMKFWIRPLIWCIFWVIAIVGLGFMGLSASANKGLASEQAHRLLDKGLTPADQTKALAILLALESEYNASQPQSIHVPDWPLFLVGGAFVACILLSFRPRLVVDLGSNTIPLYLWRWYFKFLAVTLPLWVFGRLLWPPLKAWLHF